LGDLVVGDIHLSGTGEYAYLPEDISAKTVDNIEAELVAFEELEEDEYMRGELKPGSIHVGIENDTLIVVAHIQEAVLYDSAGTPRLSFEEGVTVRLDSKVFRFNKVIYQNRGSEVSDSAAKKVETATFLKEGSILQEVYNDIENDLNRNEYTDTEHFQARAEAQAQLGQIIDEYISEDRQLFLTTGKARFLLDGEEVVLRQQPATYLEPIVGQHEGSWRILHGFEIFDGEHLRIVHVLPEDIQ
jgi:hypothetical protein